jgi:hypothetical protein
MPCSNGTYISTGVVKPVAIILECIFNLFLYWSWANYNCPIRSATGNVQAIGDFIYEKQGKAYLNLAITRRCTTFHGTFDCNTPDTNSTICNLQSMMSICPRPEGCRIQMICDHQRGVLPPAWLHATTVGRDLCREVAIWLSFAEP